MPLSIVDIIRAGSMSSTLAAMFWLGMERGASVIVAADPPSAGKTTTLTALLAFTPPDTVVYFTRGRGERFALPERTNAHPTYLLINEMSDHLPVYTWGDHARRAFDLLAEGYSLATTMHDDTVEGVVTQLEKDLLIPRQQIAQLNFIVSLYIGPGPHGIIRRVREVAFLRPSAEGLNMERLAHWDPRTDGFEVLEGQEQRRSFAAWARLSEQELDVELEERKDFLERLLEKGRLSIAEANAEVEARYERTRFRRGA